MHESGSEVGVSTVSHRPRMKLLWVNKTATSASLSHSEGPERYKVFSTAQRTSRITSQRKPKSRKTTKSNTCCSCRRGTCSDCVLPRIDSFRRKPESAERYGSWIVSPSPAAANRSVLTARFYDSYYPTGMPGRTEVVSKLSQWIETRQSAVALAASDSMTLLFAARATKDLDIYQEGIRRYQMTLELLRQELQNPESSRNDNILGTVDMMGVVETKLLHDMDQEVSRAHTRGLFALIHARGPTILRSNIGRNILMQHLHSPLMVSLLARKACVFGKPEWQRAFESLGDSDKGKMYQVTAIACCIPGAYEKVDNAIRSDATTYFEYNDLLDELSTLEGRFIKWMLDRYRSSTSSKPYLRMKAKFSESLREQPAALKDSYPFAVFLEFQGFMDVLAHIKYWTMLLMLRRTILDLLLVAEFQGFSFTVSSDDIQVKCDEIADLVCQSAFYVYGLPRHQSMIVKQGMVAFILSVVLPWYSQRQDKEKAEWCSRLLETFQNEHSDLDDIEMVEQTWTTRLYIGWVNMAF